MMRTPVVVPGKCPSGQKRELERESKSLVRCITSSKASNDNSLEPASGILALSDLTWPSSSWVASVALVKQKRKIWFNFRLWIAYLGFLLWSSKSSYSQVEWLCDSERWFHQRGHSVTVETPVERINVAWVFIWELSSFSHSSNSFWQGRCLFGSKGPCGYRSY